MSGGGNGDVFGMASNWAQSEVDNITSGNVLDPIKQPKRFIEDDVGLLYGQGKKANDAKGLFTAPQRVQGDADAVTQIAQLERNIEGGVKAGAIDEITQAEIYDKLRGGANAQNISYEDQVGRMGMFGLQERLDEIAAGKDLTVNDRQRLKSQIMTLKDRPGRAGLLTGG